MAIKRISKATGATAGEFGAEKKSAALNPPASTLMGNQDIKNRGDSDAVTKDKLITFWVTQDQRDEIKAYARAHNMSVSRLIIEGLEMRMKQ